MDQPETNFVFAALEFAEALSRSRRLKKREQIGRRLELAMRTAFKEQGRQFVRAFGKFRNRFGEAAVVASPFGGQTQDLPLQEAVPPTEWMYVFHFVAQKTTPLFETSIDAAAQAALKSGAGNLIADAGMNISFDLKNPRAVKYLDQYGAKLVTNINDTTRDYLQTIITQATNEGWSYDRTAEAITQRYKEFQVGKPQEHIDSRAHLIAVTETGNAYAEGNLIVARDLEEAGVAMEKAWSTVGDSKVTPECRANEDQGFIPLDKPFLSGHMRPLRFPGCRCDLLTRVAKEPKAALPKDSGGGGQPRVGTRFRSSDEADLQLSRVAGEWGNDLSDAEKTALINYTNDGYVAMNNVLRTGKGSDTNIKKAIRLAQEAIDKAPEIPMDLQVTRGFKYPELYDALKNGSIKVGDTLTDKGFMSTSVMNNIRDQAGQINYDIFVPRGTTGAAYLDGLSGLPEEAEVLFAPGTPLQVKDIKTMKNGGITVILEIAK